MHKIITQLAVSVTTVSTAVFGFFLAAPAQANVFQFGDSFYELSDSPALYQDAFNDAASRTFENANGEILNGYLATITSEAENNFLVDTFGDDVGFAWLGGQKDQNEAWTWINGPEAGLQFWQGKSPRGGGSAVDGTYVNWADTFWPDNAGGQEDDLRLVFIEEVFFEGVSEFQPGDWDDLDGETRPLKYIIEYSLLPDPAPQPVPEPFTILGSITALGMGAAFKKKLASTTEKK
ncbi:MAG: PEP-CTERM sorting domain-containing protein [Cyanobacteria bacterium J06592_8]